MKRSEIYRLAILAVLDCEYYANDKLEITEELMHQKSVAEYVEEHEANKAEEET